MFSANCRSVVIRQQLHGDCKEETLCCNTTERQRDRERERGGGGGWGAGTDKKSTGEIDRKADRQRKKGGGGGQEEGEYN